MKPGLRFALAVATPFAFIAPASAASNLLFILDSSGSMWGQVEGKAKMETARTALTKLINDLPKDTKVGLMAYGHRTGPKEAGACDDIELLMPFGQGKAGAVSGWMKKIVPKGKTPIAGSLEQTPGAFAGREKDNNNIVLISDGIETCDGDPCKVAGKLASSNIKVRVHVVGFDISDKDRAQLECIAKQGGGKYFPAKSTEGFGKAVTAAVKVAQAKAKPKPSPPPPPQPAKPVLYFEDNFDGDAPATHWQISGEDGDAYIVENGALTLVTAKPGSEEKMDYVNLFTLTKDLPKGDWTATAKLGIEFATGQEGVFLAVVDDNTDGAFSWLSVWRGQYKEGADLYIVKRSKGKETSSKRVLSKQANHKGRPATETVGAKIKQPVYLRLTRTGRSFIAGIKLGDEKDAKWVSSDKVTILRAKGGLVLGTAQRTKVTGESLINVDWLKIETPK